MNDEARKLKNEKIRQSRLKTKEKRLSQTCKVFQVKIQDSALKPQQREALQMQFVEAKWLVNSILAWSLENPDNKIWEYVPGTTVVHKDKDMNDVTTELKYLHSQVKQSVVSEMISNIRTLSTLKKCGKKVGKLKFRKEVKSLNLKQYGITYKILNKHFVKLPSIPGRVRVNGLVQLFNRKGKLKQNVDFANATLVNTPRGVYLYLTTFWKKDTKKEYKGEEIGVDFGCSTTVTLSNGEKFSANIQESDRLKRLQRKLARQQGKTKGPVKPKKWSKGIERTKHLIRVEYQKLANKKNDLANKIAHEILQYEHVYMQDEQLANWTKNNHGKAVQHSILGRLKAKLVPKATYVLGRFEPTTKFCYNCGQVKPKMGLSERVYVCDCGLVEDRDVHAARNMVVMSKLKLGMGRAEFTRVDSLEGLADLGQLGIAGRSTKVLEREFSNT